MTSFVDKIVAVHDSLAAAEITHAFGGALALGFHVESPRATVDIDLNISAEPDQAAEVLAGLPGAVEWSDADVVAIRRDGQVRIFWDRTPVDLFFPQHELHGVVAARTELHEFASRSIPVVSATDLTIFKAMFDREKDWVDISEMLRYGKVDAPEARRWLVRLLGESHAVIAKLDRRVRQAAKNEP